MGTLVAGQAQQHDVVAAVGLESLREVAAVAPRDHPIPASYDIKGVCRPATLKFAHHPMDDLLQEVNAIVVICCAHGRASAEPSNYAKHQTPPK